MTAHAISQRVSLTVAFLGAARRYWLNVFPRICREAQQWHRRALAIPDPVLRGLAIEAQRVKRGNVEGSAAFAAFVPRAYRTQVVRAQVAFQSIYDYVDTLAEQPNEDPVANSRQLHQALLDAIEPGMVANDYYAHCEHRDDGGYLRDIVEACRGALASLPSRQLVAAAARRATERIVAYQSLNLSEQQGGHRLLEQWARAATPADSDLRWWETAASAGSSLGLFALIAAAAKIVTDADAIAIEHAYWPWIGALHSLLDSLIDEPEDEAAGQRSLLAYYAGPEQISCRLGLLAREALRSAQSLPQCREHVLILAGMTSFYLTAPQASAPAARAASQSVLEALGSAARLTMLVLGARRSAGRVRSLSLESAASS